MSKIYMYPTESGVIGRVGFNFSKFTLTVEFRSGALYRYSEVNPVVYARLLCSRSKGNYLNTYIKPVCPVKRLNVIGGK